LLATAALGDTDHQPPVDILHGWYF